MDGHPWLGIIIIAALTIIAYFLELAKAAFENLSYNTLEKTADDDEEDPEHAATAKAALEFIDNKERAFLNAVRAGMGIALIGDGIAFARHIAVALYDAAYAYHGNEILPVVYVILATIVFIYLVVLLSHIIPDRLGSLKAEKHFFRMFGLMKLITVILAPIGSCLEAGCHILLKIVGVDSDAEDIVTEDEIISMVNESQEQGVLEAEEAEMISNIIEFDEKQTRDIMTHRTKIVAVDSEMDIESAMKGLLAPVQREVYLGQAEVRNTFNLPKVGTIAGCYVADGKIQRNAGVRLLRDGVVIYTGRISSLKRFKDDAREVVKGNECGAGLENFNDIKVGDVIEAFETVEEAAEL